jgi:hypothetical protein
VTTSRTRAVFLLGAAFIVGLALGGAAVAMTSGKKGPGRGPGGFDGRGGVPGWMRVLDLSPDVRDSVLALYRCDGVEIDSIHRSIRPTMDSIYRLIKPAVDARRAETRAQVRAILNPVQQERYDSIVQSQDDQRRVSRTRTPMECGHD